MAQYHPSGGNLVDLYSILSSGGADLSSFSRVCGEGCLL